jgi:hypothetical protein
MQTTTRKELKEAYAIQTERKRAEHLRTLDWWIQQRIYEPVKVAANDGHTAFQW